MKNEIKPVTIRVEKELWEKFKKVCRHKDSDASKEVRKFIKRYLADNAQLGMKL